MSLSQYGSALAPFIKTALSPHVRPILSSKLFFKLFSDCREFLVSELYLCWSEVSTPRNRHKPNQNGGTGGAVFLLYLLCMHDFVLFVGNDDLHSCALHGYRCQCAWLKGLLKTCSSHHRLRYTRRSIFNTREKHLYQLQTMNISMYIVSLSLAQGCRSGVECIGRRSYTYRRMFLSVLLKVYINLR